MFRYTLAFTLVLLTAHLAFASGEAPLAKAGGQFITAEEATIAETTITGTTTTGTTTTGTTTTGTTITGTTTTGTTTGGGPTFTTTGSSSSTSDDGTTSLLVNVDGAGFEFYDEIGESGDDQVIIFASQTIGEIDVHREFYVPSDSSFSRWISVFTNTSSSSKSVTALVSAILPSGENFVESTSSGDSLADVSDAWIVTAEGVGDDFTGAFGFVIQGSGASVPVSFITFLDDENNLSEWEYTFELGAGETVIIMNFSTNRSDVETVTPLAASLANLEGCALARLSETQRSQIVNFDVPDEGGGGGGGLNCLSGVASATPPRFGGDVLMLALLGLILLTTYTRSVKVSPSA